MVIYIDLIQTEDIEVVAMGAADSKVGDINDKK
jgi:hypothetical protein